MWASAQPGEKMARDREQPSTGTATMTDMGRITAYKDTGDVVLTDGEAAGSYLAYDAGGKNRPALDRFRRTFIWVKGSYILVFDDVRSPSPVDITWLMEGAKLDLVNQADGRYKLAKGQAQCEFQLVSDVPLTSKIGVSTANDHSKLMNWQRLLGQRQWHGGAVRLRD